MTLAASTRYRLYEPTVLTAEFEIPFPIFATADIDVYVDGVQTTEFTVNATFVKGVATDAEVVLNTSVTDVDVEIYGNRDPRRESNYLGNSPNLADNMQKDADSLTAVQQEQKRDFGASLRVAAKSPVVSPLASDAAERANRSLLFTPDGLGLVIGPEANEIASAQTYAAAAAASAAEADEILGASDETTTHVRRDVASGAASISLSPRPLDGSSISTIALFRDTNTTGESRVRLHAGDGSSDVRHELVAGGASFFGAKLARDEFHPIAFGAQNGPNQYDFLFSQIRYQASDPDFENLRVVEFASDGDHGGDHGKFDLIRGGWRDNTLTPDCNLPSDGDPLFIFRFTGRRVGPVGDEYNTPAVSYAGISATARSVDNATPEGLLRFHTIQGGTSYSDDFLDVPRMSVGLGVWYEDGVKQDPGEGNLLFTNIAASTRVMATNDPAATHRALGAAETAGQIALNIETSNRSLEIKTVSSGVEYNSAITSSNAVADHIFLCGSSERARITQYGFTATGIVKTEPVDVASLPAAATVGAGARHFVNDATVTTYGTIVAGGGSENVPVNCDGTNWLIG